MKNKKIILAYSGGLDTSYCAKYLSKELGYEVHAVSIDTGGFSKEEKKEIEKKAYELGVKTYVNIDAKKRFYDQIIKYLIYGNVLKNNTYPLSVSAERITQAIALIEYAKKSKATYIAHGSTGAGNDQVRFDGIFQTLAPEIEIITPIRDQQLSRQAEIEYLKKNGISSSWEKAQYSINKGLWGTSIGGKETLTSNEPLPKNAYPSKLEQEEPRKILLTFEKGELIAVDNTKQTTVSNIAYLQALSATYAIGRDIHVGDTIMGIKGRVGFEAAAPMLILKAHEVLEKHVLTKWQIHHKEYLAKWYGMLLHEGQYLDPVMRNIEAFLIDSQQNVTGEVSITLHPYRFEVNGIQSPYDLMHPDFGSYGEMNTEWTTADAKGFIKINANTTKIHQHINKAI